MDSTFVVNRILVLSFRMSRAEEHTLIILEKMILYGRNSTLLTRQSAPNDCRNCEAIDSIDFTIYQKYVCVFSIPFLPLGKMPLAECSNCRQVLDKTEFSPSMNKQYELIKKKSCTPLWTYSGLIILSLFLLCSIL